MILAPRAYRSAVHPPILPAERAFEVYTMTAGIPMLTACALPLDAAVSCVEKRPTT